MQEKKSLDWRLDFEGEVRMCVDVGVTGEGYEEVAGGARFPLVHPSLVQIYCERETDWWEKRLYLIPLP